MGASPDPSWPELPLLCLCLATNSPAINLAPTASLPNLPDRHFIYGSFIAGCTRQTLPEIDRPLHIPRITGFLSAPCVDLNEIREMRGEGRALPPAPGAGTQQNQIHIRTAAAGPYSASTIISLFSLFFCVETFV